MNIFNDYYFWFAQPSTILSEIDKNSAIAFLIILVVAFVLRVTIRFFVSNEVFKKLLMKFWRVLFTVGFSGVLWAVMRYENTPIFARRYWAGLTILIGLIWLGFVLKYLLFNFRTEKNELERELVKNKYMPKAR